MESKGLAGIHRVKRTVDGRWLRRQLLDKDLTIVAFAKELARESKRDTPLDKASISRRFQGKIPFTAREAQAMAHIFGVPLETVLAKIGGVTGEAPVVGTVGPMGTVELAAHSDDTHQRLKVETGNGWHGWIVQFLKAPLNPRQVPRGIYLADFLDGHRLIQFLGIVGATAVISPALGGEPENVQADAISSLRAVVKFERA